MQVSRWTAGIAGVVISVGIPLTNATAVGREDGVASGGPELNLFGQTLQVVLALALTLALLVGTVWLFKRILRVKAFPGVAGSAIRVLEIHYMDPKKAIALVKIVDRVLIVGYTESSMTCLGELSPDEAVRVESMAPAVEPIPFGKILSRFTAGASGLKWGAASRKDDSDAS